MNAQRPLLAADRVVIMMTLVPYVVENGPVSVSDAAREFGMTPDEMRATVENLSVIGVPDGMDHELFDIDWEAFEERDEIEFTRVVAFERVQRLTAREAAALLAGLQFAQALPAVAEQGIVAGLIAKLARGASTAPAELVVAVDPIDDVRSTVATALDAGVAVSFTYRKLDGEATTRTVDPVRILVSDDQWYLRGWCHLRKEIRTFHLDRVSDLELTDIPSGAHDDDETAVFATPGGEVAVRIRYPSHIAPLLGQYLDHAQIETNGDASEATVLVADPRSLKRLAARRGGAVVITQPAEARQAAAEWATAGLARYAAGSGG